VRAPATRRSCRRPHRPTPPTPRVRAAVLHRPGHRRARGREGRGSYPPKPSTNGAAPTEAPCTHTAPHAARQPSDRCGHGPRADTWAGDRVPAHPWPGWTTTLPSQRSAPAPSPSCPLRERSHSSCSSTARPLKRCVQPSPLQAWVLSSRGVAVLPPGGCETWLMRGRLRGRLTGLYF
jgi:hypothetical protein